MSEVEKSISDDEKILNDLVDIDLKPNDVVFEQWKTYVEMADKISSRRVNANNFFLTLNSLLVIALGFLVEFGHLIWIIPIFIIGILFSLTWFNLISSYKSLNRAKFKVINKIEEFLPVKGYLKEWDLLKRGETRKIHWPMTHLEK